MSWKTALKYQLNKKPKGKNFSYLVWVLNVGAFAEFSFSFFEMSYCSEKCMIARFNEKLFNDTIFLNLI